MKFVCSYRIIPRVVIAFLTLVTVTSAGPIQKAQTTNTVQTISSEQLEEFGVPNRNLADALAQTPGAGVVYGGGNGSGSNVTVRGFSNNGRSNALIFVDGVRIRSGDDALNGIPPENIESINVLKGPAAVAIYGNSGAAGVVNITTRSPGTGAADAYLSGTTIAPVQTEDPGYIAAGLYGEFATGVNGVVDLNTYCDFGSANLLPGWALSPWFDQDWAGTKRYGDNFVLPFDASDAAKPAIGESKPVVDAPAIDQASPAPATPPAATENATAANPPAALPEPSSAPPAPKPLTELQRWTRGIPPWSLVSRSPECANLLTQLQPLYEQRDDARGDMIYYGDFTLSDWELRENAADLADAKQRISSTTAQIAEILKGCRQPDSAPATDAPVSVNEASGNDVKIPWLALSDSGLSSALAPKFSGSLPATNPSWDEMYEEYMDELYKEWRNDPAVQFEEFCDACGEWEEWNPKNGWIQSRYQELYDYWNDRPPLRLDLFLMNGLKSFAGGEVPNVTLTPATGAGFTPSFGYKDQLGMPFIGYKDSELNSALPSNRGFADSLGQWQNTKPSFGSFNLDGLTLRDALMKADLERFSDVGSQAVEATDANLGTRALKSGGSYDLLLEGRLKIGANFYDQASDSWTYPTLPDVPAAPTTDFDPALNRLGFNLKENWAAFTLDATPSDGAIVGIDNYTGPAVRSVYDLSPDVIDKIDTGWRSSLQGAWNVDGRLNLKFRYDDASGLGSKLSQAYPGAAFAENDLCAIEAFPVNAATAGILAGERVHDQWATRAIGFTRDKKSATALINANAQPVIVAVIDTGLDWHHYDFSWDNLWRNPGEIADNGIDDDNNGYIDDIFGWDFLAADNKPWDDDGHGTFVSGLIAATRDNKAGIDGINPNARIMVLKALNSFGHTRASWLAQAIVYAVDNGARVINLSVAGPGLPIAVQDAVNYADKNGVLVVVAAGNSNENIANIEPAGLTHAITVAATGLDNTRASFSNWGERIDIAAPGVHVMSLRARQTDFRITSADTPYETGSAIVGLDRRYYRADGTSFAAPLVTATASLLWSNNPDLTHVQVRRMLEQSAHDIDAPGRDQFTGYGLLDARAALTANPEYYIVANIVGVNVASLDGKPVAQVIGTVDANALDRAWLEIGAGENPTKWKSIGKPLKKSQTDSVLGNIPAESLQGSPVWVVRIIVKNRDGSQREARYKLNIG